MKITFISPYYSNVWENIGVGYIISYCRIWNDEAEFVYMHGNFDSSEDILKHALESDIVAFSCTSPTYSSAIAYATVIKETNPFIHIVFGGWHPTAMRELKEGCVDQIVIGEDKAPGQLQMNYRWQAGHPVITR